MNARPDYDAAEAAQRWRACGHRCGCSEACSTGEYKAETLKDDRGSANMLAVVFCAVAFLLVELSFAHARFAVAALAVIGLWVTVAVPVAVVIGRGMGGRR